MKFNVAIRPYLLFRSTLAVFVAAWVGAVAAQGQVYRCVGNEYVASVKDSKNGGCKLLEGGNVTIVQGTRLAASESVKVAAVSPKTSTPNSASQRSEQRNDSPEQKTRDSDARGILESELKKAEAKQAELLKEYKGGEPDRNALDIKNPQRYVDRLAEMKANIARNESDIAGIKRELGRNQGSVPRSN